VRGTVVVAEDDPGLREVLLHVLHEAGYQVLLVSREADTLAALRRLGTGCLLILEAKLPDSASQAILQGMASGPAPITCPVVLLSGPPVEARSSNVVGVLRKPFELTRMLAVVKAFCPSPALPPSPARGSAPAAA
jgi:two-component system, NtrC family, nitrogen regulation response regulator NtrX